MSYIHPYSDEIKIFIEVVIGEEKVLEEICKKIFAWFDKNISYSRLNAPFFPLQRSDLDVLEMKSGTCGDYSNFMVSVFVTMGFEMAYAYVHKDCFGDEQDHICAAVKVRDKWVLIDATNPYRKWCGYDCPHQEYEMLAPYEFEIKMKKEENYWTTVAKNCGMEEKAGLWYAPWIHEEIVEESEELLDRVFFLLIMDGDAKPTLYVYYQHYTKEGGKMPCMMAIFDERISYQFSVNKPKGFWDNEQWGVAYSFEEVPKAFRTIELDRMMECVEKVQLRIDAILRC